MDLEENTNQYIFKTDLITNWFWILIVWGILLIFKFCVLILTQGLPWFPQLVCNLVCIPGWLQTWGLLPLSPVHQDYSLSNHDQQLVFNGLISNTELNSLRVCHEWLEIKIVGIWKQHFTLRIRMDQQALSLVSLSKPNSNNGISGPKVVL